MQKLLETKSEDSVTTPYHMFISIRSELTRKYYERRIRRFLDFIGFYLDKDIEERCNAFAGQASKDINWSLNKIIIFLQFQKGRTEKG